MIVIKFKEVLAARERYKGDKISLQDISTETGISVATLSRLGSPRRYQTNTDILDKLCQYFECSVGDLIEYRPDEKKESKTLGINDIKKRRRALEEQLPSLILSKLPNIGINLNGIKFNQLLPNQDSSNNFSVDITGSDNEGNLHFIAVKPILYHTQTTNYLKQLLKYNPFRIVVITCTNKMPMDLAAGMDKVDFIMASVVFDEIQNKVVDVIIDKSNLYIPSASTAI